MKKLIVVVGILLVTSGLALAQAPVPEEGWKGKLRPLITKFLGEKTAVSLLGEPPVVEETMELPVLPELKKSNTDASVYKQDSELRRQGKEFDALPADKKRAYDIGFLNELFTATRRSPARPDDLAKWVNVLEGGGSREGVYRGLVLDEVYASLENYQEPITEKLSSWTIAFARKFLGLAYQPEAFKQANLFFLKRTIAEKVLEMIDALESRPGDVRTWYAVFSSDLAKQFPQLWPGTIRANTKPSAHLEWAKKAPYQHIKSEVLVKLHMAMNSLQDAQ